SAGALDIADLVVNQRQITLPVGTSFLVGRYSSGNPERLAVVIQRVGGISLRSENIADPIVGRCHIALPQWVFRIGLSEALSDSETVTIVAKCIGRISELKQQQIADLFVCDRHMVMPFGGSPSACCHGSHA